MSSSNPIEQKGWDINMRWSSTCTHPISQLALCRDNPNESTAFLRDTWIWCRIARAGFLANVNVGMLHSSVPTLVESVFVVDSQSVDGWLSSSAERRTEVISIESSLSWEGRDAGVLIDHRNAVQQVNHVHKTIELIYRMSISFRTSSRRSLDSSITVKSRFPWRLTSKLAWAPPTRQCHAYRGSITVVFVCIDGRRQSSLREHRNSFGSVETCLEFFPCIDRGQHRSCWTTTVNNPPCLTRCRQLTGRHGTQLRPRMSRVDLANSPCGIWPPTRSSSSGTLV